MHFATGVSRGDSDLEKWASDQIVISKKSVLENCIRVAVVLSPTQISDQKLQIEKDRDWLLAHPFDPRNEVSADAKRIIRHLWILLIRYPFHRWIASSADPKLELATRASPTFLKVCFKDGYPVCQRVGEESTENGQKSFGHASL